MVTSTPAQLHKITCRKDIEDVIADVEYFADWYAHTERNKPGATLSEVLRADEHAADLRSAAATLDGLVIIPVDLYEEVWSALDAAEHLTDGLPDLPKKQTIELIKVSQAAARVLEQFTQYNIR
jgi:hypothetical protein